MDTFSAFESYLTDLDRSPLTTRGYLADLKHFSGWFKQTNGEPLTPQAVTPSDIREYRQHLQVTERRKAATVNRRLAALSAYLDWAVQTGQIENNLRSKVKSVRQDEHGVRSLDKKQQYALQRAIEKDLQLAALRYPKRKVSRQRDAAIVIFLLNTGLRLSELLDMRMGDITLGDRKGAVVMHHGKAIVNALYRSMPKRGRLCRTGSPSARTRRRTSFGRPAMAASKA